MPELPEVETVVVTLRPRVVGKAVTDVKIHRPDVISPAEVDFGAMLRGRTIRSVDRRGKRIVFTLESGDTFYVHLGMTGRLLVTEPDAPVVKHTHVMLTLGGHEMRFVDPRRFGGVWWIGRDGANDDDDAMGPEPLTLDTDTLAARLSKTKRAIKVALLDQKLVAGLGNIYADEALHAARIHPLTMTSRLTREQVSRLNKAIKSVLNRAIRARGSSLRDYVDADGAAGGFQLMHKVYDRAGKPCRTCKTLIERIVLGGRSTHFCPKCQSRKRLRVAAF
jgi:formamidopyrimidine-DNA glycosylase